MSPKVGSAAHCWQPPNGDATTESSMYNTVCLIATGQAVRYIARGNIRLEYDRDAPTVRHFGQRYTFKWTKSVLQRKSPEIGCERLNKTMEA